MKTSAINKKLAIVCTHPIQYYVPLFQELAKVVSLKVFFTGVRKNHHRRYDPGFKRRILWDLPMLKGYDYVFAGSEVTGLLTAFEPDQILVYGWPFRRHLGIIRHFREKIWFRGDSLISANEYLIRGWIKTSVLRWIYGHVNKAFYVGSLNKLYFLKYGLQERQLVFAPHAVDNSRFNIARTAKSEAIRKRFDIPETDLVILFAGKLNSDKNPLLLLNAFCKLNINHTHLIFAGDGDLKKHLKKITGQLPNVHLLPFQNQSKMPALYQCCDLFCLPSKSETWGLSVNEAMAAGKAVLVSDAAGAAIDLVDSQNGAVFKNNDCRDLQNKLRELIARKEQLYFLGQQSKKRIQHWSIARQVQIIVKELVT